MSEQMPSRLLYKLVMFVLWFCDKYIPGSHNSLFHVCKILCYLNMVIPLIVGVGQVDWRLYCCCQGRIIQVIGLSCNWHYRAFCEINALNLCLWILHHYSWNLYILLIDFQVIEDEWADAIKTSLYASDVCFMVLWWVLP